LNARFIHVMESLGLTGYSLSKKLRTSEAVISNVRLGKNPPNIQLVSDLLDQYKEVEPGWLLTGQGRMLRVPVVPEVPVGTIADHIDHRFDEMMKLLKKSIAVQLERNVLVDESLNALERQMELLVQPNDAVKKVRRKEV